MKKRLSIITSIMTLTILASIVSFLLIGANQRGGREVISREMMLCFKALDKRLTVSQENAIKNCKEDDLIAYHFGLGLYIRNYWIRHDGLKAKLNKYFVRQGVVNPDDMSMLIITAYHRYLKKSKIKFKGLVEEYGKGYE